MFRVWLAITTDKGRTGGTDLSPIILPFIGFSIHFTGTQLSTSPTMHVCTSLLRNLEITENMLIFKFYLVKIEDQLYYKQYVLLLSLL